MGMNELMIYDFRFTIDPPKNRMNERIGPGPEFRLPAATKPYPGTIIINTRGVIRAVVNRKS